jgi:hypothetical protein
VRALAVAAWLAVGCSASAPTPDPCARRSTTQIFAFSPDQPLQLDETLRALASGDFDGDGKTDLAALSATSIHLLTSAAGLLLPVPSVPVGDSLDLAAGDFDGDGRVDLMVLGADGSLALHLGRLGATFADPRVVQTVGVPARLAAGDVDGDGHVDLMVASPSTATFLRNDGHGNFAVVATAQVASPSAIALENTGGSIADLLYGDAVGNLELVKGNLTVAGMTLLTQNAGAITGLAACDFAGAEISIAIGTSDRGGPSLLLGQSATPLAIGSVQSVDVAAGDFDGDGRPDVASANGAVIDVFLNRSQ